MRWWLAAFAMMAGCSAGAEDALERQFDIAMNEGTYADVCEAASRVADAHLQSGDQEKFARWRLTRDTYCRTARRIPNSMPSRQEEEEAARRSRAMNEMREMQNSTDPALRQLGRDLEDDLNDMQADLNAADVPAQNAGEGE
jgi:hypothetical protein